MKEKIDPDLLDIEIKFQVHAKGYNAYMELIEYMRSSKYTETGDITWEMPIAGELTKVTPRK